jgi:hypothetical protein
MMTTRQRSARIRYLPFSEAGWVDSRKSPTVSSPVFDDRGRAVNVWREVTVLCVNPPSQPVNVSHIGWDVVDQPRSALAASGDVLGRLEEDVSGVLGGTPETMAAGMFMITERRSR